MQDDVQLQYYDRSKNYVCIKKKKRRFKPWNNDGLGQDKNGRQDERKHQEGYNGSNGDKSTRENKQ